MTSALYLVWFRKVYIQQSYIMIFWLEKLDEIIRNNYDLDLCVEEHVYNHGQKYLTINRYIRYWRLSI